VVKGIPFTENIIHLKRKNVFQVAVYTGNNRKRILGTGRTLIEALVMRDWCQANGWQKFAGGMRYIHYFKRDKCWHIHKDNEHYGVFDTLEKAMHERDCLVKCNWDYDLLVELE